VGLGDVGGRKRMGCGWGDGVMERWGDGVDLLAL